MCNKNLFWMARWNGAMLFVQLVPFAALQEQKTRKEGEVKRMGVGGRMNEAKSDI